VSAAPALRRTVVLVVLLVTAGAALAACGGDDGKTPPSGMETGGVPNATLLRASEWELDQQASKLGTVARGTTVTARFGTDGSLSGSSGCNSYVTTYKVAGATLTVAPEIAGTLRMCSGPVTRVEAAYLARLPEAASYGIADSVLTIETSGKGGPLVYHAVNAEDALTGKWEVLNYFRPGAVVSPVLGSTLTAEFAAGTISGSSGCNQYTGPYEAKGTSITIGPLASTLRACADPAVDQQETDYLAALALARTFSVAGGNLTLFRDDGGIAVTFGKA